MAAHERPSLPLPSSRLSRAGALEALGPTLGLAALLLAASGCGYAGAAAAAAIGFGGSSGGGGGRSNADPVAQVVEIPRGDQLTQSIRIRLADRESDPASIRLGFARPGGAAASPVTAAAAAAGALPVIAPGDGDGGPGPGAPGDPVFEDATIAGIFRADDGTEVQEPLPTSPDGEDYLVKWMFDADLGSEKALLAVGMRLALLDSSGKEVGTPVLFAIPKVGNFAPMLDDVELFGDGGVVVIRYLLKDSHFDNCMVTPTFRIVGEEDQPLEEVVGGRLTGLGTMDELEEFDLTWQSFDENDLRGMDLEVVVTLVAKDEVGFESEPVSSPRSRIDNNEPSDLDILTQTGRFDEGAASILFELSDPEGNLADVAVTFTTLDGQFTNVAALAAPGSEPVDLGTEPPNNVHEFVWAYEEQLKELGLTTAEARKGRAARLRFVPNDAGEDGDEGVARLSGVYEIGNDEPIVVLTSVPSNTFGDIPIGFEIVDTQRDPAFITVEFERSPGVFVAARSAGSDTMGLPTEPEVTPPSQVFVWDSDHEDPLDPGMDQLPDIEGGDVILRIKADDGLFQGEGDFVLFTIVGLDNVTNRSPAVSIEEPIDRDEASALTTGHQPIHYTIADDDLGDTHDVSVDLLSGRGVYYFLPEDPMPHPATPVAGTETTGLPPGSSSSPGTTAWT